MAGVSIRVELQNSEELTEALEQIKERSQDMSVAFADIGEYLLLSHDDRWKSEQSPNGSPWLPLSESYANSQRKLKSRGKDKILTFGGYLRLLNYQAKQNSVRVGTPMIYGATHQFGDSSRHIPARPFLGISKEDETEIIRIVSDYFKE
jgi:phage virion morphogenesis protein